MMNLKNKLRSLLIKLLETAHRQRRVVLALSCLVVFMTTYVLILPAFTLEKDKAIEMGGIDVGREDAVETEIEDVDDSRQAEEGDRESDSKEVAEDSKSTNESEADSSQKKENNVDENAADGVDTNSSTEITNSESWQGQTFVQRKSRGWTGFKAPQLKAESTGGPTATKTLDPNGDGTYTLTLSVKAPSSSTSSSNKANIVIIYDSSNSMNEAGSADAQYVQADDGSYFYYKSDEDHYEGYFPIGYQPLNNKYFIKVPSSIAISGTATEIININDVSKRYKLVPTRMDVAKARVKELAESLLANNSSANPDAVEIGFVEFGTKVFHLEQPSTSKTTIESWIDRCDTYARSQPDSAHKLGGTNWDAALRAADKIDFGDDDTTYIIFISDGNPTARLTEMGADGTRIGDGFIGTGIVVDEESGLEVYGNGNTDPERYNFECAKEIANRIKSKGKILYNIGIFGDADVMDELPNDGYFDGSDSESIQAAFNDIVGGISSQVGYKDVQVTDGITSMTSTAIVGHGRASDFTYRLNGEVVTDEPWMTASFDDPVNDPANGQYESGRIHWNLGADYILESGATYSVSFVVWPNQHSYDLVAELNNGIKDFDELTPEEQSQFHYVNGKYVLKTNTVANATFKHSETGDITNIPLPTPDPMPLTGSETKIEKQWIIDRDPSILYSMLYDTRDKNNNPVAYNIKFDVQEDNKSYLEVNLPGGATVEGGSVEYDWDKYDETDMASYGGKTFSTRWEEDLAIATGLMLSEERMDALGLDKTQYPSGTFGEEADAKRYYILDEGHDYQVSEPNVSFEFDFTAPVFHPMLVDGVLQSVNFTMKDQESNVDKVEFTAMTAEETGVSSLHMENTMRGYIHLRKKVVDSAGADDTEDKTEFKYDVTLNNEDGKLTEDHIPWYGIDSLFYHDEEGNYYQAVVTNGQLYLTTETGGPYPAQCANFDPNMITGQTITYTVEGVTKTVEIFGNQMEASNGGKTVTATLTINQDQTLNIANVPAGTTYSITEASHDGYVLDSIKASQPGTTQNGSTIEGIIVPNDDNDITYTNKKAVGSIELTKKVTLDGSPTTTAKADGDYYFTILDNDNHPAEGKINGTDIVDGQVKITVTNGKAQTVTITDVPIGTYHIVESAPNNGTSLSGIEPADAPNIDLDSNTSGDVVVETGESTAVTFTNDKSSTTIDAYTDHTVVKKWLDKDGNELNANDVADKTIKYRITQKRAVVTGSNVSYPVVIKLFNYDGSLHTTRTYYVKYQADPVVRATKSDNNRDPVTLKKYWPGYSSTYTTNPDPISDYKRVTYQGIGGIVSETLVEIRPSNSSVRWTGVTMTSQYMADNPEDYINTLDNLNYQDYDSAEVELSAGADTAMFELGGVTYSAENSNWTSVINNLPLYNRVGNDFYVYKYEITEVNVDGETVTDNGDGTGSGGRYTVTYERSGDGKSTTIKNTVSEDAPELPSSGGIGTTLFYIFGSMLVLGCGVVLVARSRMRDGSGHAE